MKKKAFRAMLGLFEMSGIPITYYSYPEKHAPDLPYAVYYFPGERPDPADDKQWTGIRELNIELYSREKDFMLEYKVDEILRSYGLIYTKTETYLNTENMFQILYQTEVTIWDESDMD